MWCIEWNQSRLTSTIVEERRTQNTLKKLVSNIFTFLCRKFPLRAFTDFDIRTIPDLGELVIMITLRVYVHPTPVAPDIHFQASFENRGLPVNYIPPFFHWWRPEINNNYYMNSLQAPEWLCLIFLLLRSLFVDLTMSSMRDSALLDAAPSKCRLQRLFNPRSISMYESIPTRGRDSEPSPPRLKSIQSLCAYTRLPSPMSEAFKVFIIVSS